MFAILKQQLTNLVKQEDPRMPEIVGESWINSTPLTIIETAGKVILVNFFTYSSSSCLKSIPFLQDWWHKYQKMGFILIGVHSPEFQFEHNPENVIRAIKEYKIDWPVVLDNEFFNWEHFENQYWPATYLSNRHGEIVYTHFGEDSFAQTEQAIQELLMDYFAEGVFPAINNLEHQHNEKCFVASSETYCGLTKGKLLNSQGFMPNDAFNYQLPNEEKLYAENIIGLNGKFLATTEYIESLEQGATLYVPFHATEVYAVLGGEGNVQLEINFEGQTLTEANRGKDVGADSTVNITYPKMYNLVKSKEPLKGFLSLKAHTGNFQSYAFSFSGCI